MQNIGRLVPSVRTTFLRCTALFHKAMSTQWVETHLKVSNMAKSSWTSFSKWTLTRLVPNSCHTQYTKCLDRPSGGSVADAASSYNSNCTSYEPRKSLQSIAIGWKDLSQQMATNGGLVKVETKSTCYICFRNLHCKQTCLSCYLRSIAWTLKSLHDICSPCHHFERQPCGTDHNKSTTEWNEHKWAVWDYTTNGGTVEIPATC
jgi:hypothetical protein